MSLGAVLVTGLLAGGASCAAVQGGLLTGLVSRQRAAHAGASVGGGNPSTYGVADDLAPIGAFLTGKLASHVLLGAALGSLGSVVELSTHARGMAQIVAGVLVVVFGLAQLEVPGFKGLVFTPPTSWTRLVRGSARSQSALAPAILGFLTLLVPCGVTLAVMALALTSGSWVEGAATMGVFVIGTSPLFGLIGYAAIKAATAWRHRLATATGLVLLAVGLYTLNGGLTVLGSPLAAHNVTAALGERDTAPDKSSVSLTADGTQSAVITVTPGAYSPANLQVQAQVPTKIVFRAENAAGCARGVVIPSLGVEQILPENGDTVIDVGALKPGRIDYSCSMGMYRGVITVTDKPA